MGNYLYKTVPFEHQDRAVHFVFELFMKNINYAALFMEQGTGKTKTTIDIASNMYKMNMIDAVLVVAPNGVQSQWAEDELPIHSPIPYTSLVWEGVGSQKKSKELFRFIKEPDQHLKWFLVNVEAFSYGTHLGVFQEYLTMNRCLMVIDEATRIKTPDSNRTINIIQGMSDVIKAGKRVIDYTPYSKYRMILTGTQVTNSPFDLWSMMEFLKHDFFKRDYFSFCGHHGLQIQAKAPQNAKKSNYYRSINPSEMDSIRKYAAAGKDFEAISHIMKISESSVKFIVENPKVRAPYKNLDELKQEVSTVAFQVRKADCLDLPPKTYMKRYVFMSGDQAKAYKDLKDEFMTMYEGKTLTIVNQLSLMLRLQQVTGGFFPCGVTEDGGWVGEPQPFKSNAKMEELLAIMEETYEFPIIISARFVPEIHLIKKTLKDKYPDLSIEHICGEVSMNDRSQIIDRFKRGEVDVLVANPRTISMGFNLQASATMDIYSNSFSFEERAQLEDRIHRSGQTAKNVVYNDIMVKGSVDEKVYQALRGHRDLLDYMRDKGQSFNQFLGGL